MSTVRTEAKGPPFLWSDKRTIRRIRERCEDASSAVGIYLALCEVDSDNGGKGDFATTHEWLSRLSGFSPSTVKRRLPELVAAGVLEIATPTLRAPCRYRLLGFDSNGLRALGHSEPALGHSEPALGHSEPALGHRLAAPWPTSEERRKKKEGTPHPLTTAQRIGLEKQRDMFQEKITRLNDQGAYEFDRTPEWRTQLEKLKAQLEGVESRLMEVDQ